MTIDADRARDGVSGSRKHSTLMTAVSLNWWQRRRDGMPRRSNGISVQLPQTSLQLKTTNIKHLRASCGPVVKNLLAM